MDDDKTEDALDKSDLHQLFETCIHDLAFAKNQQWKTVHLTLIALAAILIAVHNKILCGFAPLLFLCFVVFIGSYFMYSHYKALLNYREHKTKILQKMPDFYQELHNPAKSNVDVHVFFWGFILLLWSFAIYVFWRIIRPI